MTDGDDHARSAALPWPTKVDAMNSTKHRE